jgi:four helix bundle protein
MQRFTELKVWQRSHSLVLSVYRMTTGFPQNERYGLISQVRRSALSVPTNIAEGSKRITSHEYARFLNIAEASLAETEYLLMVSRDLGYITPIMADKSFVEISEISRMLHGLCKKVEAAGRTTTTGPIGSGTAH